MVAAKVAGACRALARWCLALGALMNDMALPGADALPPEAALPSVAQIAQLSRLDFRQPYTGYSVALEGDVLWADIDQGKIVLRDASGASELELDLGGQPVQAGRRVRLAGSGPIARSGAGFRIGVNGPVVDNNGVHPMIEKSGAVYLWRGLHPIRLDWFNGVEKLGLEVEFEGPGLSRRKIPGSSLVLPPADRIGGRTNGLAYRCFEGDWLELPDFNLLTPIKTGAADGFDLGVKTREEHAGLQFAGFIEVQRDGLYIFHLRSDDGSILWVGEPSMKLDIIGPSGFPKPQRIEIGQRLAEGFWAEVEGKVNWARQRPGGWQMELQNGGNRLRVEATESDDRSVATLSNRWIRVEGFVQGARTVDGQTIAQVLLTSGGQKIETIPEPFQLEASGGGGSASGNLPLLTNAVDVHRLKREEAQRGYRVQIRGVVTCVLPEHQAFTLQDATRGLYVAGLAVNRAFPPRTGEYLVVEGVTDPSLFAPIVNAERVSTLGAGQLPEPVNATWDQLLNGSLDAQYVEIQGIATETHAGGMTLLTREGSIMIELRLAAGGRADLVHYDNALVRVRGCLFASWNYITHQVGMGPLRVYDAVVAVDRPAPADLFSIPVKAASDLLLFDPQGGVFQRVKVAGQIVHVRGAEYFMMDGTNGLRFFMNRPDKLEPGDRVEVVGFPRLSGGAAPVLREAIARKTGREPLPTPCRPPPDDLVRADYDSRWVRVDGLLLSLRKTRSDLVLEMRQGSRTFVARLETPREPALSPPIGSRLELTGVYAAQGGNRAAGQDIASFELLLHSPAGIRVLARPSWWTLRRLLVMVGALTCLLAVTALWITQLRRQVDERTVELETQIQARQRVEHQRAMALERARVAQDLHDELGSGLTEIGMLADRARLVSVAPDEKRLRYLQQIGDKTRQMVAALDEIVWAMNPRHDTLASLASYFRLYADRFLGLAGIAWRLEGATGLPDIAVDSHLRHQLFLAFKEALNNVVRHSGATEVRMGFQYESGQVRLSIADNGRGLSDGIPKEGGDGLDNMRGRVEKLGGRFEAAGAGGTGAVLRFYVPLN